MKAPSTSSVSQSMVDPPAPVRRARLPRFSLVARLWIALVVFLSASLLTIFQAPRPDAFRRPRALFSTSWWRYPLEWNAPSRLPKIDCGLNAMIDCSLNAIYAEPGSGYVWAVGNKGMVIVSTDGGLSWNKRGIAQDQITRAAPSPTPTPKPAEASFLDLPDLIPTAHAATRTDAFP